MATKDTMTEEKTNRTWRRNEGWRNRNKEGRVRAWEDDVGGRHWQTVKKERTGEGVGRIAEGEEKRRGVLK